MRETSGRMTACRPRNAQTAMTAARASTRRRPPRPRRWRVLARRYRLGGELTAASSAARRSAAPASDLSLTCSSTRF